VYVDSQSAIADDSFQFSRNTRYPTVLADFAKAHGLFESMPCDVVLTPHPGQSQVFERLGKREAGNPSAFRDSAGCRAYGAWARQRLADRLKKEAGGTR
jgi:metallo-beta-lactamase class B